LIRRIFVIVREDGAIDQLAGKAYVNLLLSQEGQALIDKAGYLPIRYQ
jgi:phosphate transport system substrate-binding protein